VRYEGIEFMVELNRVLCSFETTWSSLPGEELVPLLLLQWYLGPSEQVGQPKYS